MIFDVFFNLGIQKSDDVNRNRLIRQINGLNLFYTAVALSVGILAFTLLRDSFGGLLLAWVQVFATLMYAGNLFLNRNRFRDFVRHFTIFAFEIHLFLCALITGFYLSPVMLVIVLFPLLAALVEVSLYVHLGVGFVQLGLLVVFHYFFPEVEASLNQILGTSEKYFDILRVMGLAYFPVMGAGIMRIIFNENLRARIKQKQMLSELNKVHQKLKVYADALKDESIRLKAELNIAKEIQEMVLPDQKEFNSLHDQDIACIMRPADEVGGDYYDIIETNDELLFGIGDVTGHGLASGLIMMMAQTAIRTIAESPKITFDEYLPLLNRILYANINRIKENRNMTLSLFRYKGKGQYEMSGQHEFFLIYRAARNEVEVFETMDGGFFIGMIDDISDFSEFVEFHLNPEDVLLLFSDGVTEAENEQGEQFGLDNLVSVFQKNADSPAEHLKQKIIRKLYNFMGQREILDDISLLIIKQKGNDNEEN